jgi:hypothetical protein
MEELKFEPTNIVTITGVSNGQHHIAPGDGETYFVGKKAEVKSTEEGKVWVEPDGLGYVIWFAPGDLKI